MSETTSRLEPFDSRPLADRTCLVTGASRGIGRAIALELARCGADVAVNYRSSDAEAREVKRTIEENGETAMCAQADVSKPAEVERMAADIHDELGEVDVLINNAGITIDRKFEEMTHDDWQTVLDVNLGGTFNCTKAFFDDIRDADHGRLVNISSVVGQQGNYGQANYATSKGGMFAFTRTLALELAASESTANCVAPGFVRTDMLEKVPERVQSKIRDKIPLNRFADPEDIVGIIRFLASDHSSYMTGQVLGVNGGLEW